MENKLKGLIINTLRYLKNVYSSLSIQAKIILSIVLGISILVTLCAFLLIHNTQANIDKQVQRLNNNLKVSQILAQLSAQVIVRDYGSSRARTEKLSELVNDFITKYPNISFVIFTDLAGNILYRSNNIEIEGFIKPELSKLIPPKNIPNIQVHNTQTGKVVTIAEPIQFNSNLLGWVWIGKPDSGFTIVGSKKELLIFLIEIFLLVWIISVIGAIVNSLIIIRPLKKLEKSAKAITEGRFGFQLPMKGFLGNELTQLVKAFNKMSKRLKQYEESNLATLNSEKNKFESVLMSIADGVLVSDNADTIQIINPQAAKLLDRSSDELTGQKITSIWDEKANGQIQHYLTNSRTLKEPPQIEYSTFEFIKDKRNLKLLITPLHDINKDQLGATIVIQDRTKEAEVELIKQEFISNVSHELRTPITSIKCYVDTLCSHSEQIDNNTKEEFLYIVNEETDRLSTLVNDVLELSRLESPSTKILLTLQDVYPSIEYAFRSISVLAKKKSIQLTKEIEEDLPLVYLNQENIERVLINLLSNAIKYTPGNGTVKLIVKKDNDNILFQIIDNGIGIDEEHIPLIFERFYRVENKVHTIKGTGLGLTIVNKSIEQHGGKISVRSKLGEGTVFEFNLPILQDKAQDKVITLAQSA